MIGTGPPILVGPFMSTQVNIRYTCRNAQKVTGCGTTFSQSYYSYIWFLLGEGNLIFCWMGSRQNYFGSVGKIIIIALSFRVGTSKNKNYWSSRFCIKSTHLFVWWFNDFNCFKFLFFIYFIATQKRKIILEKNC